MDNKGEEAGQTQEEMDFMAEREKIHQAKSEGISVNTNRMVIDTEGKVSGSNEATKANFAKLLALQQKGGKKHFNKKDQRRVNYKLNEQKQRAYQEALEAKMQEQKKKEDEFWAPQGKEDEKFNKKMQKKLDKINDDGPSKGEQKRAMEDEDDMINGKKQKVKKNGWGKVKGNA